MKVDWKKRNSKSCGFNLSLFALLYFTGMASVIQGAIQSVLFVTPD